MIQKARVFLTDDHPILLGGLVSLINSNGSYEVCGQAVTIEEAHREIRDSNPDIAIVDLAFGNDKTAGMQLVRKIRNNHPEIKILMLSHRDESLFAQKALEAGADGYIMKDSNPSEVLKALGVISTGEVYLSEAMQKEANRRYARRNNPGTEENQNSDLEHLTKRQREVYVLLGFGKTTDQIAKKLGISSKTVDSHRKDIKERLKIDTHNELMARAAKFVIEGDLEEFDLDELLNDKEDQQEESKKEDKPQSDSPE